MNKKNMLSQIITALVLLLNFQLALATIPSTLNYQGHLTDSSGVPVDGAVNMVFTIYDIDTGGTALWSDSRSVTTQQGVFSVELGGTANPFPVGLFQSALWVGLTVATDTEMTPRRPISSVGFSFRASDADTLEGSHASSLDQSAHVTDTTNPHSVTAAQVGALSSADLTWGNLSNIPLDIADGDDIGLTNELDPTVATSVKDGVSWSEVSSKPVGFADNIDNDTVYTNKMAVAAIKAADGAGSTLDADLLDGLQASEVIDAAQDEVRTPIVSLPFDITTSGSYYLVTNLSDNFGISVQADDVTIDLMGYTLSGTGADGYGIYIGNQQNVEIRNGSIRGFGYAGIFEGASTAKAHRIINVRAIGNGVLGTTSSFSGIYLAGSNHHVERCTTGDNGGYGIFSSTTSKIIDNNSYNNTGTNGIYGGSGSIIRGNTAYSNAATGIYGSTGANIKDNIVTDNSGTGIFGGTGTTITGNTANSNTGSNGIYGNSGSNITGNTTFGNTGNGIYGGSGATVSDNTSYNNDGSGIYAGSGSKVTGNSIYANSHWGIYGVGSNHIKNNTIYSNNVSITAAEGGLRVGAYSRVMDNHLDNNNQYNILVYSWGSNIESNTVINSDHGIFFNDDGNFYGNNRSSHNTSNFDSNGGFHYTDPTAPNISYY